jgi:hypothetical protein
MPATEITINRDPQNEVADCRVFDDTDDAITYLVVSKAK